MCDFYSKVSQRANEEEQDIPKQGQCCKYFFGKSRVQVRIKKVLNKIVCF